MVPLTPVIAALLLAPLAYVRRRLKGTTLVAVWCWAVAAVCVITFAAVIGDEGVSTRSPLNFAAAMIVFCPAMALLGAKRPQDKAWQLIVLSLWGILALPSLEGVARGSAEMGEIHPARSWFLLILLLVGAVNHLPTRFWPSALLVAAGQAVITAPWLPIRWPELSVDVAVPIAIGMWLAALLIALLVARSPRPVAGLNRLWLEFRDAFGAVWALRVIERVNAASSSNGWPVRLTWHGFEDSAGEPDENLPPDLRQNIINVLSNVLRRFVSQEWIAARLKGPARLPVQ